MTQARKRHRQVSEDTDNLSEQPNSGPEGYIKAAHLAVLNPTGLFFDKDIRHASPPEPGTWHWWEECPDL